MMVTAANRRLAAHTDRAMVSYTERSYKSVPSLYTPGEGKLAVAHADIAV